MAHFVHVVHPVIISFCTGLPPGEGRLDWVSFLWLSSTVFGIHQVAVNYCAQNLYPLSTSWVYAANVWKTKLMIEVEMGRGDKKLGFDWHCCLENFCSTFVMLYTLEAVSKLSLWLCWSNTVLCIATCTQSYAGWWDCVSHVHHYCQTWRAQKDWKCSRNCRPKRLLGIL